jgi:hypothetical protein
VAVRLCERVMKGRVGREATGGSGRRKKEEKRTSRLICKRLLEFRLSPVACEGDSGQPREFGL